VFTQTRRGARADLLRLVQPHGAVDRQIGLGATVVDGYEYSLGDELRVTSAFFECLDDPIGEVGGIEQLAPFGQWPCSEDLVQQGDDLAGVGVATGGVVKARVVGRLWVADGPEEEGNLFCLVTLILDTPLLFLELLWRAYLRGRDAVRSAGAGVNRRGTRAGRC
jgi:hypothetical protein